MVILAPDVYNRVRLRFEKTQHVYRRIRCIVIMFILHIVTAKIRLRKLYVQPLKKECEPLGFQSMDIRILICDTV